MRILDFFRNRRQAGFPVIKAIASTGKAVLLGTENPADDPAPNVIANYRKLWGALIGMGLAYAQKTWGWDISDDVVMAAKDLSFMVLTGLLTYAPRNNSKAS